MVNILTGTTVVWNDIIAVLLLCLSYVIGSIPFGILIGKGICHVDIREHGSKNIGSTNAIRVLGKKVGFLVFFCDVFKGMVVIILIRILNSTGVFYKDPIITNSFQLDMLLYGAAAIIGHCFSIFLKFKGGKAVATSLGVIFMISPLAAILCLVAFLINLYATGYVSLASTFASLTVTITCWVLYGVGINDTSFFEYFIAKQNLVVCIIVSLLAAFILIRHRKNYVRLLHGTENNFKKAKKEKKAQAELLKQELNESNTENKDE